MRSFCVVRALHGHECGASRSAWPSFVVFSIFSLIFIEFSSSAPQAPHSPPHSARTTSFPPTKIAPFPVDHIWNVDLWRSTKNMGAIKMDGWNFWVVQQFRHGVCPRFFPPPKNGGLVNTRRCFVGTCGPELHALPAKKKGEEKEG